MTKFICRTCGGTGEVERGDPIQTPPRIVQDPGVVGGVPRIDGTRIPVASIKALARERGLTVGDIEYLYPDLTSAHIQLALAWDQQSDAGER
jgi:uncharacterized protein (DUF433 family)